ncbi:hypothetical protein [Pengzhenrongella phosphoraccumulans]|uniref:hypothetical protein n=1 Tax=Pengzhenrongella phosphoraccumulans TaxID=3114394 RepID=UPI003890ECDB
MAVTATVFVTVIGGAWWLNSGTSALPDDVRAALPPAVAIEQPAPPPVTVVPPPAPVAPTAEVVALADEAHLSVEGRELFYAAKPEVLGAREFAGRCVEARAAHALLAGTLRSDGAVGCYNGVGIVLYAPADPRLRGSVVESAAHETLHAAWDRLSRETRTRLGALLEVEVAALAADHPMRAQIAGSVGSHQENRPTELFAYVGTQVWRDGGLAPQLEATYSTVFTDRAAVVAVYTGQRSLLERMQADITATSQASAISSATTAQDRAQYDTDRSSVDIYRQRLQVEVTKLASMSPEQGQQTRLSWVWWDGTNLAMAPAEETLASATALLARDDVDLRARDASITAAEAADTDERARVDGLVAELRAIQAQRDPTTAL